MRPECIIGARFHKGIIVVELVGVSLIVLGCGLLPKKLALSDAEAQPFLRAIAEVDRVSLGFTPIPTNARVALETRPRAGYDAMLHVHGDTSRTIAFRKGNSGYRWIAEQEIHIGPSWQRTIDGTFRERIVIEFQTERVNGIPTNELAIRYYGSDSNLLQKQQWTLSNIQPVLARWKKTAVEPKPPALPDEGFDPAPLMFMLMMLILALGVCLLALISGVVATLLTGSLVTAGIISVAVLTGLLRKSVSSGFRALFILVGTLVGLVSGTLGGWGIASFGQIRWNMPAQLAVGGLIGVTFGMLMAWLFNKAWTRIADWLAAWLKHRR